jgi:hypothetical protein
MQVDLEDVYSLLRIQQVRRRTAGPIRPRSSPLGPCEIGFWVSDYLQDTPDAPSPAPDSPAPDKVTQRCRAFLQ